MSQSARISAAPGLLQTPAILPERQCMMDASASSPSSMAFGTAAMTCPAVEVPSGLFAWAASTQPTTQ
eukprot:13075205-Alexandrium_andersonii.AAC.1